MRREKTTTQPIANVIETSTPLQVAEREVERLPEERRSAEIEKAASLRKIEALTNQRNEFLERAAQSEQPIEARLSQSLGSLRDQADIEGARVKMFENTLARIDQDFVPAAERLRIAFSEHSRGVIDQVRDDFEAAMQVFLPVARKLAALGQATGNPMHELEAVQFLDPHDSRRILGRVQDVELRNGTWMPSIELDPEARALVAAAAAIKQKVDSALARARRIRERRNDALGGIQ